MKITKIGMKNVREQITDIHKKIYEEHETYALGRYDENIYMIDEELFNVLRFLDEKGKLEEMKEKANLYYSIDIDL